MCARVCFRILSTTDGWRVVGCIRGDRAACAFAGAAGHVHSLSLFFSLDFLAVFLIRNLVAAPSSWPVFEFLHSRRHCWPKGHAPASRATASPSSRGNKKKKRDGANRTPTTSTTTRWVRQCCEPVDRRLKPWVYCIFDLYGLWLDKSVWISRRLTDPQALGWPPLVGRLRHFFFRRRPTLPDRGAPVGSGANQTAPTNKQHGK